MDPAKTAKFDPSFKSKRYRDRIRLAVKELESLLPVDRSTVHRKLDSQTVFRLTIAYFRTKLFLEAAGLTHYNLNSSNNAYHQYDGITSSERALPDGLPSLPCPALDATTGNGMSEEMSDNNDGQQSIEALGGFVLIVTSDGTILYVSNNILQHLGFNQVDLMLRCIYGIVHPDDHEELKMVLEHSVTDQSPNGIPTGASECCQRLCCMQAGGHDGGSSCRMVSFLCRIKCFNGTTAGYLKMHCMGHMRSFPHVTKSQRTSNQVLFAFCRPFVSISSDLATADVGSCRSNSFSTKHDLDMRIKLVDEKMEQVTGYSKEHLLSSSFYSFVHPDDLPVVSTCHRSLVQNEDVQTTYFRLQHRDGHWIWVHTRCKILMKNSRKYAISCTHCPVREEDSTYIQQEAILRQRYSFHELVYGRQAAPVTSYNGYQMTSSTIPYGGLRDDASTAVTLHDPHGYCPSSWHQTTDRHSPVFPVSQMASTVPSSYKPDVAAFYNSNTTSEHYQYCNEWMDRISPSIYYQGSRYYVGLPSPQSHCYADCMKPVLDQSALLCDEPIWRLPQTPYLHAASPAGTTAYNRAASAAVMSVSNNNYFPVVTGNGYSCCYDNAAAGISNGVAANYHLLSTDCRQQLA